MSLQEIVNLFARFGIRVAAGTVSAVGILLLCAAWFYTSGQSWKAERQPLHLRDGTTTTLEFRAEVPGPYFVRLDTSLVFDRSDQNCLLGIALQDCSVPSEVDLSWQIILAGRVVGAGRSSGRTKSDGYWAEQNIGRIISRVHAERGRLYRVQVVVNKTATRLQRANPAIEVVLPGDIQKGHYVRFLLLMFAGCLSVAIAASLLIVFVITRGRR